MIRRQRQMCIRDSLLPLPHSPFSFPLSMISLVALVVFITFLTKRSLFVSLQRLTKDLEQNEDKLVALNAMVKQLDQVCDTKDSMAALGALRQRVQHVGGEGQSRLAHLEDANKKIEDYEKEIGELTRWMEETRTHISMRDTTRDLKEQLAVQEVSGVDGLLVVVVVVAVAAAAASAAAAAAAAVCCLLF